MSDAYMIIKEDDVEDANVVLLSYEDAQAHAAILAAYGFPTRPIAHGLRFIGKVDENLGEVAYIDFVDALAFEAYTERTAVRRG